MNYTNLCISFCSLFSSLLCSFFFFFFFNDTATTEIYTLSLHDALPICRGCRTGTRPEHLIREEPRVHDGEENEKSFGLDRKSTRLNSSHLVISYAVFCLKKKKKNTIRTIY